MKLLAEVHPKYCPSASLFKWSSERTGLQVVLVKKSSPVVNGYFTVATEINDDSGCPHTLEHLVFMGSKKYPYKGLLDTLGNKQLSSTNAWTGQDQTVYTLNTAGWEGFKTLLPIYVDHIVNPTITDAACTTEVYHVDGKAEEKGVVFSEMQGVENTSSSLISRELKNLIYQPGSGYATDTGGLMSSLRTLTSKQIRDYHAATYAPSNISLLIIGDVEPDDLIATVSSIDDELVAVNSSAVGTAGHRPFIDSPMSNNLIALDEDKFSTVPFPDTDEEFGEVCLALVGPKVTDLLGNTAIEVLSSYLSLEGAGKLQTKFVDVENALSTCAFCYTDDYLYTILNIYFMGVPSNRMQEAANAFVSWFRDELITSLDMTFLQNCVKRARDEYISTVEDNGDGFSDLMITEFLYGDDTTFSKWTENVDEFDTLLSWSREDWVKFLEKFFVSNHFACVSATPSADLYKNLKREAELRRKDYKETRDLAADEKRLAEATEENNKPVPNSILESFPKPDVAKINFIATRSASNPLAARLAENNSLVPDRELQAHIDGDLKSDIDIPLTYEHYPSQFVSLKVLFAAEAIDPKLLPLISPVLEHIFEFPMRLDDGTELNGQQVAELVKDETLSNLSWINDMDSEYFELDIKCKVETFDNALKWLERAVANVVWDPSRIRVYLQQHLATLSDYRRDSFTVMDASELETILEQSSLQRQAKGLLTEEEISTAAENIDSTVESIKLMVGQLFTAKNARVLVYGNVLDLTRPVGMFAEFYKKLHNPEGPVYPVPTPRNHLSELGRDPSLTAIVSPCTGSESANVIAVAKGVYDYANVDIPAIRIATTYLEAVEGPLWRAVRGGGYAYGARIALNVTHGHVEYSLYRAADVPGGISAIRDVVRNIANGGVAVDLESFANCVNTIVNMIAAFLNTSKSAAVSKYLRSLVKGRGPAYVEELIAQLKAVTPNDMIRVLKQYFLPLFDAEKSMVFVASHPSQVSAIVKSLVDEGYDVEERTAVVDSDEDSNDELDDESDGDDADAE